MSKILPAVFAVLLPIMATAAEPQKTFYLSPFAVESPNDKQQREHAAQLDDALKQALLARQIKVQPLNDQAALPDSGWLIQGQVSSQAGRRLVRTAVGFGAGASAVEAQVWISDLAAGEVQQLTAQDRSGRLPGALLTRNPQLAAAKFLLERRALNRNIDEVAGELADDISRSLSQTP
ncbi:DUF4410 domain-containing protein [Pseudomonas sp. SL4(2022)]|uniref:DUF4410 domain-containing protein n=1 Tax=Pseudomonas sp. SL4(2022) TaxID=2994661 RepID=UPI00227153CA|nr:DUF4410 domain-containing protein [Pseudomonas sp. SL4(2022)]WAC46076.1 DUF4410 domain-containing protein [Pseudomonas sp. SL4(2022)]